MLPLVQIPDLSYKLVISKELQEKIDYTCAVIHDREWSGTLFYNIEGGFDTGDLIIRAVDFLLEDIGSTATTEFGTSPDVITYLCDHNLVGVKQGLIHSHHSMSTFFSLTDKDTLCIEGQDKVHFVSLIVNNKKEYSAAVTRKVREENRAVCTYTTFDGTIRNSNKIVVTDKVEYINLNVEMEVGDGVLELISRIEELKEKCKPVPPTKYINEKVMWKEGENGNLHDRWQEGSYFAQGELFREKSIEEGIQYESTKVTKGVVDDIVRQLITGCVLTNLSSKIDINKIAKGMYEPYKNRFKNDMKSFEMWAEPYVEFLIYSAVDANDPSDVDYDTAVISYHVKKALLTFPQNIYVKAYIKLIESYII